MTDWRYARDMVIKGCILSTFEEHGIRVEYDVACECVEKLHPILNDIEELMKNEMMRED